MLSPSWSASASPPNSPPAWSVQNVIARILAVDPSAPIVRVSAELPTLSRQLVNAVGDRRATSILSAALARTESRAST